MRISRGRFWGLRAGVCVLSILAGCASVTNGTSQTVTIDTLTADGKAVEGAECSVANDKLETTAVSGSSVQVRRSGGTLNIECRQPGYAPASGQATSRVNTGMVGNVLLGGMIGAAIDSSTGAGFNYPSWIQMVFGEVRMFDRSSQVGDQPLAGVRVGETKLAATPSASPATLTPASLPTPASPASPATPVASSSGSGAAARVSMDDLRGLLPSKP